MDVMAHCELLRCVEVAPFKKHELFLLWLFNIDVVRSRTHSDTELFPDNNNQRLLWTLKHSYYANSGGFRLKDTSSGTVCSLHNVPLNSLQIAYCLHEEIVDKLPDIRIHDIDDKSKADYFAKAFTVLQVIFLIPSTITRLGKHLPISLLEIVAVVFALCTTATYGFCWDKPQGVSTATIIGDDIGNLDFRSTDGKNDFILALSARETVGFLSAIRDKTPYSIEHFSLPDRVTNDNVGGLHFTYENVNLVVVNMWLLMVFGIVFGGIHLAAWEFHFPTTTERQIWRCCNVVCLALPNLPLLVSGVLRGLKRHKRVPVEERERAHVLESIKQNLHNFINGLKKYMNDEAIWPGSRVATVPNVYSREGGSESQDAEEVGSNTEWVTNKKFSFWKSQSQEILGKIRNELFSSTTTEIGTLRTLLRQKSNYFERRLFLTWLRHPDFYQRSQL